MKLYLKADDFVIPANTVGDSIYRPALGVLDLSDKMGQNITSLVETHEKNLTQNRTVEGRLVTDMVTTFKTWTIVWHRLLFSTFNEIKKFVDAQCDKHYCLKLHIDAGCNNCAECGCGDDCEWVNVWVSYAPLTYYKDGGASIEDFELTLVESKGECA